MTLTRQQVPTFFASQSASNYDPVNNPLDLETQTKHSLFLVKGGVRGLVILGSTGEAIHLTNKERNELISSQRKELDNAGFKDRPIIAGTATQNIEETLIQLEDAKKAGAEYGMVLTPGYFASAASQQGIAKWFEAVADKSPIPIMMYVSSQISSEQALMHQTAITTLASPTTSLWHHRPSNDLPSMPTLSAASYHMATSRITL
jgi:dihydrodipicolinate synthase/N-acetylneuraminate lyase